MGSDRPDDQTVHPRAELHTGLIPVSGVRQAAGGVNEAVGDKKKGGNGVEGTFNKDMTNDGMNFEVHKQIVKPLSLSCAGVRNEKKCACVHTVRCYQYRFCEVSFQEMFTRSVDFRS